MSELEVPPKVVGTSSFQKLLEDVLLVVSYNEEKVD